jgi:NADPH:quinone reductase-like Zn-dependent oxidoreductase
MMRQVVYRRFGVPEDVLEIERVSSPSPGEGEVAIALEAAPIHLADLKHIRGLPWFDGYKPPYVPGYEGVGRISACGAGVSGWKEGDRVFLPVRFGAWQEHSLARAEGLWAAPEGIPAEQLALIPINLPTAYLLLKSVVPLRAGDWIAQNAANSNVGYYLIQLAKRMGVHTVNIVRRAALLAELDAAGGDLNVLDGVSLGADVAAHVPRGALKLAIDAIAGDATTRLGQCFGGAGGIIASYGLLSGEPCKVPPEMLMLDDVTLTGFYTSRTVGRMSRNAIAAMQAELNDFLVSEPPQAPIAGIYRLDDVCEAVTLAALAGDERTGKVILVP